MDTTYEVFFNWDFGAEETRENLTLAQLREVLEYGVKDEDGGAVTSITIFTPTTSEYQARTGAIPIKNGEFQYG